LKQKKAQYPSTSAQQRISSSNHMTTPQLTFAKGDRMNASPSGDEADVLAADVGAPPLFAMEVVWKLSISCDMTFRCASSLKKRK